jgi:outer membrane receptor protein involved in Fe transport
VRAGEAVAVYFYLQESVVKLEKVVVTAKKPMIEPTVSATAHTLSKEEIEATPLADVSQVIKSQAGVIGDEDTELHIRGGRSNEVLLYLDGIPLRDPLGSGSFGLYVPTRALKEVSTLTGGFNAEYGEASGIIEATLKGESGKSEGIIAYYNDHLEPLVNSFNTDQVEIFLSGMMPSFVNALLGGRNMSFFANIIAKATDTYLPSAKTIKSYLSDIHPTLYPKSLVSNREENTYSFTAKLGWQPHPNHKLTFVNTYSLEVNQGYFYSRSDYLFAYGFPVKYLYHLDHYLTFTREANVQILGDRITLNPRNLLEIRLSRYFTNLHADVQGKKWTEYTELADLEPPASGDNKTPGDLFYDTGDAPLWHDHNAETYTLKTDFTSQLKAILQIKTGLILSYTNAQWIDIHHPALGELGVDHDLYRVHTTKGGIYFQTQVKFAGMVANLGSRIDFWIPGAFADRRTEEILSDPDLNYYVRREYERYINETLRIPILGYRMKAHWSPRIGVSFPVSPQDKFFFSYGHFTQMPDFRYVYSKLGRRATSGYELVGNPNLKPQIRISYEMGLEHLFDPSFKVQLTAYYSDIFNYPTAQRVPAAYPNPSFWMYFNADYARNFGIEIEAKKRLTRYVFWDVSFTVSRALGRTATSEDYFIQGEEGGLKEYPLPWDTPYKLWFDFGVRIKEGEHPQILIGLPGVFVLGNVKLPDQLKLDLSLSFHSGKRYTPLNENGDIVGERNSAMAKPWFRTDVRIEKSFNFFGLNPTVYVDIKNLFDTKNVRKINPVTGRPYEPGDPYPSTWDERLLKLKTVDPSKYASPRIILLGVGIQW